jgi:CheY-like chemotaxis protein
MMTVILGFSSLLLNRFSDDPRAADLRQIHRAANRASTITHQLLAFSRRQQLRPEVLDLNQLIRGSQHMLRRVLGEDKVFALELSDDLGAVRADAGQLEQVLLNLALNARDAMPTGGTFTIGTRNATLPGGDGGEPRTEELPEGSYVQVTVRDTGHGMDEATRARVFEPFFTTKPVGHGTGLGLATVFGIVRQSGGTVTLESTPGQGTTFSIYLPQVPAESAPTGEVPEPARAEPGSGTVLVVEDEALVRDFTCQVLTAHGYRCVEAGNGAEALAVIRKRGESIAVVLTDVVMPVIGGGALAQTLAELRPGLPVLFTSAHSRDEVVRRGLIPSEAPFLQKPFTPQALVEHLRNLLIAARN